MASHSSINGDYAKSIPLFPAHLSRRNRNKSVPTKKILGLEKEKKGEEAIDGISYCLIKKIKNKLTFNSERYPFADGGRYSIRRNAQVGCHIQPTHTRYC